MNTPNFTHPEDAAALKTLQAIPALSSVVKAFMNMGIDQPQIQFARVSFLLPQLKQTASPAQIDQIRELL